MLPISDLNPTRRTPILTYALIIVNIVIFVTQLGMNERQLFTMYTQDSVVPALFSQSPFSQDSLLDALRSMFLHGGWLHVLSNMLYLWIFGDNIEDRLGKIPFLLLYFASGFGAIFAQVAIDPTSRIPLVGASGAIAGVLGAYLLLFPRARVRSLVFLGFFAQSVQVPAFIVLGFWFVLQLFDGVMSLGATTAGGGVAFFAHIGGFIVGLVLAWLFTLGNRRPPDTREREPGQVIYWR
jgi:membrane associated rhomboid family serine protease